MGEIISRCPSGEPRGTGNDGEGVAEGASTSMMGAPLSGVWVLCACHSRRAL
jgi:hypothetical protein